MPVTREQFNSGQTYAEYRQHILDENGPAREKLAASEETLALAKLDLRALDALPEPVHVLVLSEDWCSDCTDNLPILDRIATESGKLDVRILHRDEHLALADEYLNDGQFRSIPTMIFLDQNLKDIGTFHERPDSVTSLRAEGKAAVYASNPEFGSADKPASELPDDVRAKLSTALADSRAKTRPFAIQEVVREIAQVATRATTGVAAR
jgi:hypothetical protein